MTNLERLKQKAKDEKKRFSIKYNPMAFPKSEAWNVKFYIYGDTDAHFYSFAETLDDAAYKILEEMEAAKEAE